MSPTVSRHISQGYSIPHHVTALCDN